MQSVDFMLEIEPEQPHKVRNFARGSPPVLGGEGIDGQTGYPKFTAGVHDDAQCFRTLLVTSGAGQSLGFGPAAVAVHDNRDVTRQCVRFGRSLGSVMR